MTYHSPPPLEGVVLLACHPTKLICYLLFCQWLINWRTLFCWLHNWAPEMGTSLLYSIKYSYTFLKLNFFFIALWKSNLQFLYIKRQLCLCLSYCFIDTLRWISQVKIFCYIFQLSGFEMTSSTIIMCLSHYFLRFFSPKVRSVYYIQGKYQLFSGHTSYHILDGITESKLYL